MFTNAGVENPALQLDEIDPSRVKKNKMVSVENDAKGGTTDEPKKLKKDLNNSVFVVMPDESGKKKEGGSAGSEEEYSSGNCLAHIIVSGWKFVSDFMKTYEKTINIVTHVLILLLYNAYLVAAIHYNITYEKPMGWCDGLGFLIIVTILFYIGLFYYRILLRFYSRTLNKRFIKPLETFLGRMWTLRAGRVRPVKLIVTIVILSAIIIFLIVDTIDNRSRLISALGLVVLTLLGFIFSKHPEKIIWRHVYWGLGLQFIFGLIILRWEVGRSIFDCLGNKVSQFLSLTDAGSSFVFGYLVDTKAFNPGVLNETSVAREVATQFNEFNAVKFVFFFKVLTVIYFFSFGISILYYWGVMQWVVMKIGWCLQVTVGTTAAESMSAAANIFVGQSEAPLVIKPYLSIMTKSEIHAVMTGGFATIAGSVLAAYISFGISPTHLLSASVMSAPAALAYSKLFYPETEVSSTKATDIKIEKGKEANILDAASQGATNASVLVLNIAGNLIAFLAFIEFLNVLLGWFGGLVGIGYLSFEYILGKVFIPLAWVMGVDYEECEYVAILVGLKSIVNEFAAYDRLTSFRKKGYLSPRSEAIAVYALCGFSNPGSIGIQLGAFSGMAAGRMSDFAQVVFRAFLAGSAACFLSACIAGALIQEEGFLSVAAGVNETAVTDVVRKVIFNSTII